MPDSRRGSKSQSCEADSQNETPEHHLRHTERQHEASPGSELPEPGEAAGQRGRTQRAASCSRHGVHRHDREDKRDQSINSKTSMQYFLIENSVIRAREERARGVMRVRTEHPGALLVNKSRENRSPSRHAALCAVTALGLR